MVFTYKIDEKDFLIHQLYVASMSDRIKKKRQKSKVRVPAIYIFLGLFFVFLEVTSIGITLLIISPLWYFFYPIWEKGYYIKHYKGFIIENYKDRIDRNVNLEINNEFVITKENGSESKVLTSEFDEIVEIPSIILIKFKNGQWLILPKDKINELDLLTIRLKELAAYLNINYSLYLQWKWK